MSYVKQKNILTITATTPLNLYDMGEVYINSSADITVTIPDATNYEGLWYRFINGSYISTIQNESATTIDTMLPNTTMLVVSDGTNYIVSNDEIKESVVTKTDTATLTIGEQGVVMCNKSSAMTINLPTAVGNSGLYYNINNINSGTVTIDPNASETIQGDSTFDIYQDETLSIISNGTNWYLG